MSAPPSVERRSARLSALLIAAGVVALDQATKAWALAALDEGPIRLIDDFLRLALARNSGAAFGLLRGVGSWLALLAVIIIVTIFMGLRVDLDRPSTIALGLILGGAIGNLIDRLFRGSGLADGLVVDFIDFNFWPTFNVADSAITVGALIIVWEGLRSFAATPSEPS